MSQAPPTPRPQDRDGHSGIMPQLDTLNILVDKLEEINFLSGDAVLAWFPWTTEPEAELICWYLEVLS